jgi:hypothetical protein
VRSLAAVSHPRTGDGTQGRRLRTLRAGVAVFAGVVVLAACGSSSGATRPMSNIITYEEIQQVTGLNAYEVVQQLRPHFLRMRGSRSLTGTRPEEPVVYVDNIRSGGLASLRDLRAAAIEEIRFIPAADATTRWGTGHMGGAILIKLRS